MAKKQVKCLHQINTKFSYKDVISSADELANYIKKNEIISKIFKIKQGRNISLDNPKERYIVKAADSLPFIKRSFMQIIQGIQNNESFLILPDYDADGTVSGFMYYNLLTLLKAIYNSTSEIKIKPTARDEGYGISQKFFDSDIHKNIDNIVTTDIGISIRFPMEFIKSKKRIIIFDHHAPLASIWFSIAEFRERFETKYPEFDILKKSFSKEEKKHFIEEMKQFFLEHKGFENIFAEKFMMNNFVINYYPDYYLFFKEKLDLLLQEKKIDSKDNCFDIPHQEIIVREKIENPCLREEYDKIYYSSAGELSVAVYEYALNYLLEQQFITKDTARYINFVMVGGSVTSISDVTDLSSSNNMFFYLAGGKVINVLQDRFKKKIEEFTKTNPLNDLGTEIGKQQKEEILLSVLREFLWKKEDINFIPLFSGEKLKFYNTEYQETLINNWLFQMTNFLLWLIEFDTKFTSTDLGFSICPSINAYGRISVTHSLFLEWIKGHSGVKRKEEKSFNQLRKEKQAEIAEKVFKDIEKNKRQNDAIVIGGFFEEDNLNNFLHQAYDDVKSYFALEHSDVFLDYVGNHIGYENIGEVEDILLKNAEGVVGIVASKVAEAFKKPAIVGKYDSKNTNSIKGSGRSLYSLFDLGISTFKSITNAGGHAAAFGISISDIELFQNEINTVLNAMTDEEIKKKYLLKVDMLLNVKNNVRDLLSYEKFFNMMDNLIKVNASFKDFSHYTKVQVVFMGQSGNTIKLVLKDGQENAINFMIWDCIAFCKKFNINFPTRVEIGTTKSGKKKYELGEGGEEWLEELRKKIIKEEFSLSEIQTTGMDINNKNFVEVTCYIG